MAAPDLKIASEKARSVVQTINDIVGAVGGIGGVLEEANKVARLERDRGLPLHKQPPAGGVDEALAKQRKVVNDLEKVGGSSGAKMRPRPVTS